MDVVSEQTEFDLVINDGTKGSGNLLTRGPHSKDNLITEYDFKNGLLSAMKFQHNEVHY